MKGALIEYSPLVGTTRLNGSNPEWFEHFIIKTNLTKEILVLLILDSH